MGEELAGSEGVGERGRSGTLLSPFSDCPWALLRANCVTDLSTMKVGLSKEVIKSSESPPPQPSPGVTGEGEVQERDYTAVAPLQPEIPRELIELSESASAAVTVDDLPRMEEPPPVRLVTVRDAVLPARAGIEMQLDAFYVEMLKFDRDPGLALAYRAANFAIVFQIAEPPVEHESMRSIGVEVQSLSVARQQLTDREIEHIFQRGLLPGHLSILLKDPAGNWIELIEAPIIR